MRLLNMRLISRCAYKLEFTVSDSSHGTGGYCKPEPTAGKTEGNATFPVVVVELTNIPCCEVLDGGGENKLVPRV